MKPQLHELAVTTSSLAQGEGNWSCICAEIQLETNPASSPLPEGSLGARAPLLHLGQKTLSQGRGRSWVLCCHGCSEPKLPQWCKGKGCSPLTSLWLVGPLGEQGGARSCCTSTRGVPGNMFQLFPAPLKFDTIGVKPPGLSLAKRNASSLLISVRGLEARWTLGWEAVSSHCHCKMLWDS